jgi:holo-ACP synthase
MGLFSNGKKQTIVDVLKDRDQRAITQKKLLEKYPYGTLIVIKLNIPGPIKNNDEIHQIFTDGVERFRKKLLDSNVMLEWNKPVGNTCFLFSKLPDKEIKKIAVMFEDIDEMGRFFDIDVLSDKKTKAISRSDLGMELRKCFICGETAKKCARSRKHTVEELQRFIQEKNNSFQRNYKND